MKFTKNQILRIVPEMPTTLKAKLEFSPAIDLFRIAADHHIQYRILVDTAWKDVQPVIDWFLEQKKYDEGIDWLYNNTPDVVHRTLAVNQFIKAVELNKKD